jgi:hypothetical protein
VTPVVNAAGRVLGAIGRTIIRTGPVEHVFTPPQPASFRFEFRLDSDNDCSRDECQVIAIVATAGPGTNGVRRRGSSGTVRAALLSPCSPPCFAKSGNSGNNNAVACWEGAGRRVGTRIGTKEKRNY